MSRAIRESRPRGRLLGKVAVAFVAAAASAAAATAQVADGSALPRPNRLDVMALFVSPTAEPVEDVYGSHTGVAVRFGRRLGQRFGLAVEVGQRSASGSTPTTGSRAELDTTHAALTARWHPRGGGAATAVGWEPWLGAGLLYQSLEETVRFPDETVSGDDSATGALLGLGVSRTGRSGWGFGGEVRYALLSATDGAGEDVDLDALEVLAGVGYSF